MTLKKALEKKNVKVIRDLSKKMPVAQIAELLEKLSQKERVLFFRLLNTDFQSEIFSYLDQEYQNQLVGAFTDKQMNEIIGDLYADEIADLVEEVPDDIARRILHNTQKERRALVNKILKYSDDAVGSVMTVDIVSIKQTLTVADAIKLIKDERDNVYFGHYFFVTDSKENLVGAIRTEDLIFEGNGKRIKDIMFPVGFVKTTTDKEVAANEFAKFDMSVLPVVDSSNRLIGVITSDDMIDVVSEEAEEDFQKMAGIDYDDTPYSKASVWKLYKSRIIWLMLLMISATVSQIVLDAFQGFSSDSLDGGVGAGSIGIWTTAIVAILPVISGAAGNAGSQSSTMVIRSLATGDITTKDYLRVFWKELRASSLIGITLAIANFIRLAIYYSVKGDLMDDPNPYIWLSFAASVSLLVVIVLAKVVGGILPLIAKSFKLDPAVMAAPVLTTVIDALSTMIFFAISIGIMIVAL